MDTAHAEEPTDTNRLAWAPRPAVNGASKPTNVLLILIVIFTAFAAFYTIIGFAYSGYSTWKANRVVDQITDSFPRINALKIDASGTWTGTSSSGAAVKVRINSSDKLNGMATYTNSDGGAACDESWTETSRDYGTIYVEEKLVSGSPKCYDVEWKITVEGNTMTVTSNWSSVGQSSTMTLHKSS